MTFTVTFTTEEDTLHEDDETFSFAIESAKLPDNVHHDEGVSTSFDDRDDDDALVSGHRLGADG